MDENAELKRLIDELQAESEQVKAKEQRLNLLWEAEQERIEQAKRAQLVQLENDAKAFRLEASQATTDDDRATLRRYAKEAEEKADALRIDLGIVSDDCEPEADPDEGHKHWLSRQIWGNLNLSILFLSVWFLLYYVGEGATGNLGYIAQVLSKPAFHAFLLFAGLLFVFLVIRRYFYSVTEYLNRGARGASLAQDFQEASLQSRLFFVLGLLYVITQFLASIYQITL
ncbi:hypothetical protein GCM10028807_49930 [Spirosoma daeguense]